VSVDASEASELEHELQREAPVGHPLRDRTVRVIARRGNRGGKSRKDVLFQGPEGTPVFWVHLTWTIERDPKWPSTETYEDMADFLDRWNREEPDDSGEEAG
jgi:hypothetical protein